MIVTIATIGVYGFTAESFLAALSGAEVDTLVDIRRRRGVRGSEYAFANSQRLQSLLAGAGIRYGHELALAPGNDIRRIQAVSDETAHVTRRKREALNPAFIKAYERTVLDVFDPDAFVATLPGDAQVIALLCVEREATACHRSLAARRLSDHLDVPVLHLTP